MFAYLFTILKTLLHIFSLDTYTLGYFLAFVFVSSPFLDDEPKAQKVTGLVQQSYCVTEPG